LANIIGKQQCRLVGHHLHCPSPPKRNFYHPSTLTSRERSEDILNEAWQTKENIRSHRQKHNLPFTRIERAYVASAISVASAGEMEHDEAVTTTAEAALQAEMEKLDATQISTTTDVTNINIIQNETETPTHNELQTLMAAQQNTINQLARALDELSKLH
jgi:hypothetical protein